MTHLHSFRCLCIILGFFLTLSKVNPARGQTFLGAGPEALGQAGRAAVHPVDSHYLNPAALPFSKEMSFGTAYQMAAPSLPNPQNTFAIVVTDNGPDKPVTGSFGYLYRRSSFTDKTIVDQDFSLDFATKIFPTVSLGVQGRRLFRQVSNGGSGFTKHNVSAGVLVLPAPFLGFSFVAYDMLNDDDLDMIPVMSIGSHIVIMDIVRLRADVTRQEKLNPEKKGTLNLGMEITGAEGFFLRTGGAWDTLHNRTFWTGGLAWEGPKLCLAYAYRDNVNLAGDTAHTLEAWLNF